ncbi:MAG: hypothetical protein GF308_22365 [Candidatus Heimdallarchaeota archaeon]|nr:hypothetical protein [Candidatus Heimdallarchaeota archaeon]
MDEKLRAKIVKEWTEGLPFEQKVIKLFQKVRDIPFGRMGSRDPEVVYEKNMGTCSGKNLLLRELYDELGIKTKDMLTLHRFNDLIWFPTESYPILNLPTKLKEILKQGSIYDFHNFVKIYVNDKWIDVDATFDKPLKKYGFIINDDWDGKSDMTMCVVGTKKIWDCHHKGLEEKERLTALLPEKVQRTRKMFLRQLTDWITERRKKGEI